MRFLARCIANSLGIMLAALAVPGFRFTGEFVVLLGAGALLALAQTVIRPILKLLSLPLVIITLGLFLVIINVIILKIVDYSVDSLEIASMGSLLWGTVVVSLASGIAQAFIRQKKND